MNGLASSRLRQLAEAYVRTLLFALRLCYAQCGYDMCMYVYMFVCVCGVAAVATKNAAPPASLRTYVPIQTFVCMYICISSCTFVCLYVRSAACKYRNILLLPIIFAPLPFSWLLFS